MRCDVVGGGGGGDGVEEGGAQGGADLLGRIHHRTGHTRVSLVTLVRAVLLRAGKARPSPRLMTICWGKRWVQYDVCTPIWVSHNRPKADMTRPAVIAMRGPTLGTSFVAAPAATITPRAKGRKATPALAAE